MGHVCRIRWVWGRPQQATGNADATTGTGDQEVPASRSLGDEGLPAAGATLAGGPPGDAGGLPGGQRDLPLPMERASSSSGPGGTALSTTPLNFPGMHAVRRSGDLASTLDDAPQSRSD